MPRANHPVDAVLRYFRTAEPAAAEQALHVARTILKERATQAQVAPAPVAPVKARSHKRKATIPKAQRQAAPAAVADGELVGARD